VNIGTMTPRQLTKLVLRLPSGALSEHVLAELRHPVQRERHKDDPPPTWRTLADIPDDDIPDDPPAIYGRRTLPWR